MAAYAALSRRLTAVRRSHRVGKLITETPSGEHLDERNLAKE